MACATTLEPDRAQAQVEPARPLGVGRGGGGQVDARRVVRAGAQVVGQRQPFDRRLGEAVLRREGLGGRVARGEGSVTVGPELVHRGQAALSLRARHAVAVLGPDRADLAPRPRRLGQLARQLGALGVGLERLDAEIRRFGLGPQLERLTKRAGHVAVRVHAPGGFGRVDQPRAGARLLAGGEPVTRDLDARPPALLHRLRQRHVEPTTLDPGHVRVQGLARQRVPKRSPAGGDFGDQLAPQELGQPGGARRARHHREVELLPGDRGDLGRRPPLGREVRYADEHGIADGVGHRHLTAAGELEPAPAGHEGVGEQQRLRELLDEEGDALGPVVDRANERRSRGLLQEMREQLGGLGRSSVAGS